MTGGAKLESPTSVTVTIETSDDPGGLFGFMNGSQLSLVNPSMSKDLNFVIQREGGAEGEVQVSGINSRDLTKSTMVTATRTSSNKIQACK